MGQYTITDRKSFKIRLSSRYKWFMYGMVIGAVVGGVATFAYGYYLLGLFSIAVTPVSLFALPLVLVGTGALFLGALFSLLAGSSFESNSDFTVSYGLVLSSQTKDGMHQLKEGVLGKEGEYTLSLSPSRYSLWAAFGGIAGVSTCLVLGWMFMGPITAFAGVALSASPFAMMGYSCACAAIGGATGALTFGGLRVLVGRTMDRLSKYKKSYRYSAYGAVHLKESSKGSCHAIDTASNGYFCVGTIRTAHDAKEQHSNRPQAGSVSSF